MRQLEGIKARTSILAVAVYPRSGDTGRLDAQNAAMEAVTKEILSAGGQVFRVMHAQLVALLPGDCFAALVGRASKTGSTAEIEVRAICTTIEGPRDGRWLDSLLGDLSVRRNFGSFTADQAIRWIDGVEAPEAP